MGDDFVKFIESSSSGRQYKNNIKTPKIYKDCIGNIENYDICKKFVQKVMYDFYDIYPHLKDKILQLELHGPIQTGLSQNPERYSAKGIRPHPLPNKYPNLYMSGTDLTVDTLTASIISSWMCVNSIMGYDYIDYTVLKKDVIHDIALFSREYVDYGEEEELLPIATSLEHDDEGKDDGEEL